MSKHSEEATKGQGFLTPLLGACLAIIYLYYGCGQDQRLQLVLYHSCDYKCDVVNIVANCPNFGGIVPTI